MRRIGVSAAIIALVLIMSGMAYAQAQDAQQQAGAELVNVNIATIEELQQVPGMDQALAQSIVEYRQANGPFSSVKDLSKVQGMDEQKLKGMKGYLTAEKIDINTATAEQLKNIPGMDESLAQSIVDYRQANGPFSSVDGLSQVQGMDQQKLDSVKGYLTADKINLNTATAEQLKVIPGLDETLAQSIVEYRQVNGPFSSVDDLSQVQGMDQQKLDSIREHVSTDKINLNTATAEHLLVIPGLDESLAQNIVEYRQTNGPFSSVDDLSQVSGITEDKLIIIREHVSVEDEGGGMF
ncbi:MAG: ComEA family DNA-binding protein [Desulfomonilia bacterium]